MTFRLSPGSSLLFRVGHPPTVARLLHQSSTVAAKFGRPVALLDGDTGVVLHRSVP